MPGGQDNSLAPPPTLRTGVPSPRLQPAAAQPTLQSHEYSGVFKRINLGQSFRRNVSFESEPRSQNVSELAAEAILRALAPESSPAVFGRLQRERVRTAGDLARLDKEDLRDLGLGMVDRSRVLAWSRCLMPQQMAAAASADAASTRRLGECASSPPTPPRHERSVSAVPYLFSGVEMDSILDSLRQGLSFESDCEEWHANESAASAQRVHLEKLEQQADFWCALAASWSSPLGARCRRAISGVGLAEIRESLLESLFDLSHDRVKEVFEGMCGECCGADGSETPLSVEQLRQGLAQYGLPEPNGDALHRVLEAVVERKGTSIQLAEFETIVSRLTLAQLVLLLEGDRRCGLGSPTARPRPAIGSSACLSVVDYGPRIFAVQEVLDSQLRMFFFGHRPAPSHPGDAPYVRWVHLRGFDLMLLLALTVKYGLHPLAVEDTIEQAPSKADRYGGHYFMTIEGLCLGRPAVESEPVLIRGYHVSVFCAGPPMLDTVISFAQANGSFDAQFPVDPSASDVVEGFAIDGWAGRIRKLLSLPLCRARERRADYLIYKVLDVCTHDVMTITRAYIARLGVLENRLNTMKEHWPRRCLSEVVLARRQLHFIARRIKGLQRAIRKLIDDRDMASGLRNYLQDIIEHIDEATDDCERLANKCAAMADEFDHAVDRDRERRARSAREHSRRQESRRSLQAERQNNILFVLTLVTTIFAPVQFIAGVYGMNFVDETGRPTIPELMWGRGYMYFWALVLSYLSIASMSAFCLFCRRRTKPSPADEALESEDVRSEMDLEGRGSEFQPLMPEDGGPL